MRRLSCCLLATLLISGCSANGLDPAAVDPPAAPATTVVAEPGPQRAPAPRNDPQPAAPGRFFELAPATHTCAELETNLPPTVDDSGLVLEEGLLTLRWGDGMSASLQVLDDKTCTPDTQTWKLLVRPNLDVDQLYRAGVLCDFHAALTLDAGQLANAATALDELEGADELCS